MIVLTGGAGFIGSCFLWKLNREGISDIIVVDDLDSTDKWKNLVGKQFLDYIQKDDFLRLILEDKLPEPSHIVHMGACSSTTCTDGDYFIKNNYEYSKILAQWAFRRKAHFLYASSAATYGDGTNGYADNDEVTKILRPLNMYGFSKQLFDLWVLDNGYDKKATGIKFFNVFGPNEYHKGEMMSIVCKKFNEAAVDGCIRLFKSYKKEYEHGEQKRDFIYVKDAVEVMFWMFKNPEAAGIFNLGTGIAHTWNELAGAMFKALGKTPKIEYIEMPEYLRPKYQYFTQAKIDKLRQAGCDIEFSGLDDAVADYVKFLKNKAYL
ncbi:MAG: ADP-glyceromanno-heptose 6-epimerase [Candidatus Omnitrophica bacterium]|nr:ADP-glyceromanno-heptose 6-epimerase [Candidatus Omnitrophota bacterium]